MTEAQRLKRRMLFYRNSKEMEAFDHRNLTPQQITSLHHLLDVIEKKV
jgi:hypothetical protein